MNKSEIALEGFTTNQLIDMSDNLTAELRKIQDNFDHTKKSRDEIDRVIKERWASKGVE